MKLNIVSFILLVLLPGLSFAQKIDRESYYDVLSSEDPTAIDRLISDLDIKKQTASVKAYKGALIAKRASYHKKVGDKISVFKKGAKLLEEAIEKDPKNPEFRFLRLSVQENCPKILKYNSNLDEDKKMVINNFNSMESDLRNAILDYSKHSKIINPKDLH